MKSVTRRFTRCWILVSTFILFTGYIKTLMAENLNESHEQVYGTLTWDGASAPLGRFLLIRKNKAVCAVRFTKAQRGHDAKPATMFNSGEESFSAEYDWYFQGDGSGDFTQPGVLSGHERLARNPLKGIGRLAFQTGKIYVKCGTLDNLLWLYPTWVSFYGGGRRGDYGIELSPTKWEGIQEVNVHDPHLKWFRYDENRKPVEIPLDDL